MSWDLVKQQAKQSILITVAPGAYIAYEGGKWSYNKLKEGAADEVMEITEETAKEIWENAAPYIAEIGEAIGELGDITLSVIKGAGIALVEGASDTYGYVARQVAPYRVEAVAVVWSMIIYGLTISTIVNSIWKATNE